MGEWLFDKWLDEEVKDIQLALLLYGIRGLLQEYELWLGRNKHINIKEPTP